MPVIRGNSGGGKPIVRVVLLSFLPNMSAVAEQPGATALQMLECRALLDTGADGTSVSRSAARAATLRSYGKRPVVGVGGLAYHRTWACYLGFYPEPAGDVGMTSLGASTAPYVLPEPLLAIEIPDNLGFEVIIRRDVLLMGTFIMRRGGEFELELPTLS